MQVSKVCGRAAYARELRLFNPIFIHVMHSASRLERQIERVRFVRRIIYSTKQDAFPFEAFEINRS